MNTWFDPIDPLAQISTDEICKMHFKLFGRLQERGRTSISELASFSYLASLDLFIHAAAQIDYESCINMAVVESPNQWTTDFVTSNSVFLVWDKKHKN